MLELSKFQAGLADGSGLDNQIAYNDIMIERKRTRRIKPIVRLVYMVEFP